MTKEINEIIDRTLKAGLNDSLPEIGKTHLVRERGSFVPDWKDTKSTVAGLKSLDWFLENDLMSSLGVGIEGCDYYCATIDIPAYNAACLYRELEEFERADVRCVKSKHSGWSAEDRYELVIPDMNLRDEKVITLITGPLPTLNGGDTVVYTWHPGYPVMPVEVRPDMDEWPKMAVVKSISVTDLQDLI